MEIVLLELRYKQVTLLEKRCFLRTPIHIAVNKRSNHSVFFVLFLTSHNKNELYLHPLWSEF